jgi:tetratricopeptide (TPR) repeat protein
MNKESAFDRKHIEGMTDRRDIWDELNLPPQAVLFLQKHGRNLLIGIVGLVLIFLAWSFHNQYSEKRQGQASALLAEAFKQPAGQERTDLLLRVDSEYSGTAASIWSRVQLAHDAHAAGEFREAIAGYENALKDLQAGNPLAPLLHYSLGQSYEAGGDHGQALPHYQRLASTPGFKTHGLLAEARIHELQNRPAEAIRVYEQLAILGQQADLEQGFVENKLATLKAEMQTTGENQQ